MPMKRPPQRPRRPSDTPRESDLIVGADAIRVDVPPPEYREGVHATIVWNLLGMALISAQIMLGDEKAIGIYLSRGARELRRMLGPDQAAIVMHGYADTMHEAAKNDLPEEEKPK